jgi:hypothetical protein
VSVSHTEDEESPYSWDHERRLDIKESAQLVRTHHGQREVGQPEQEEGEHACRGDSLTFGNVVWDVGVVVSEHCTQHVGYQRGTREGLHTEPDASTQLG